MREKSEVVEIREYETIQTDGAKFLVKTKDQSCFRCRNIVIASGCNFSKTLELCGVPQKHNTRVVPVKGQIWATDLVGGPGQISIRTVLLGLSGIHYWNREKKIASRNNDMPPECTHDASLKRLTHHLYGRMSPEGQLIFGGDRILDYSNDYIVLDDKVEENYRHAVSILPGIQTVDRAGCYCCYMPFSMDGKPIVGQHSPGVWGIGGFGPHGVSQAPGAGRLLALKMLKPEILTAAENHVLEQIDCNR